MQKGPESDKFVTFTEEEQRQSQKSAESNGGGDINLAMGQPDQEGHSLDSSSLLRFHRSNLGDDSNSQRQGRTSNGYVPSTDRLPLPSNHAPLSSSVATTNLSSHVRA